MVEIEGYKLPDDLFYTDRHVWIRRDSDGNLTLGIDDIGQKLISKVMFVRMTKEGAKLKAGQTFGTCESMKWVERLTSPITGIVKRINNELKAKPSLINLDPYGSGWIITVEPSEDAPQELSKLVTGPSIADWARKEIEQRVKRGGK
jgi:glycine cleavage system H protein